MTEELNSEEVHGGGELGIAILASVEVGGCSEGINENERWLCGVVGVWHSGLKFRVSITYLRGSVEPGNMFTG